VTPTLWAGVLLVTAGAPGPKDPPAKPDPLVGVWELESVAVGGAVKAIPAGGQRWEFAPGGKLIASGVGLQAESRYAIDPKADPPEIDFIHGPDHPLAGGVLPGIYKVEAGRLTVALNNGQTRPTGFETPTKAGYKVCVFRRVKPKD
jgi:uncharacterized protein (TIGR03067 family)